MQKDINKKQYSLGDIISSAWHIYKNNFKLLLIISLLFYLPLFIILKIFEIGIDSSLNINIIYVIISIIFIVIVTLIGNYIPAIAVVYSVDKKLRKQNVSYKEAIKKSFSRFFPVVGTSILFVIFLIGLLLLLIVPGIIFSVYWLFSIYAVVLKNISGKKALDYSKAIVKKRWWRVLGITLVITIPTAIISSIISKILLIASSHAIMEIIANTLTSIIGLFITTAMTVFFINMDKVRTKSK